MKLIKLSSLFSLFILMNLSCSTVNAEPADASWEAGHFYNEFLACTAGPDYSKEDMDVMIAEFNTLNLSNEITWIGGYAPIKGKNSNSNGWWEIQWTSQDAAEAGWQAWMTDKKAQAWDENYRNILDCDNTAIFGYEGHFHTPESIALKSWDKFAAAEIACKFNEGKGREDLKANVEQFIQWLETNDNGEQFSFGVYNPVGEDQADFYWFNWHTDFDSMARGTANWEENGKAMQAKINATATCSDPNLYNGGQFYASDSAE